MESIQVLSLEEAIEFNPKNNTFLIRILGPDFVEDKCGGSFPKLLHSDKFMKILCSEFDDVTPRDIATFYPHSELFESYHAEKIINYFGKFVDKTDHLVVHCYAGLQRSPAVAAALNHIFDLRIVDDSFLSFEKHSPNMHVYHTMINSAKGMGKTFPFYKTKDNYFLS